MKSASLPDLRSLEVFTAVIAAGSMTAAARQLGMGQPGITRVIRDLELTLGFGLFIRNGPRISPTPQALVFYEDARSFLNSYERIAERAARLHAGRPGSVTLAATPTMAAGMVPALLAGLGDDLPDRVHAPSMDAEHLARCLLADEADYAVSSLPLIGDEIECIALAQAELVAALPDTDTAQVLHLHRLARERLLSVGNNYRIRNRLDAALAAQGIEPAQEMATNTSLNAMMAARAGLGIAVVDPVSARAIRVDGVKIVPIEVPIPYEWGLFRRSGAAMQSIEPKLLDAFARQAAALGGSLQKPR